MSNLTNALAEAAEQKMQVAIKARREMARKALFQELAAPVIRSWQERKVEETHGSAEWKFSYHSDVQAEQCWGLVLQNIPMVRTGNDLKVRKISTTVWFGVAHTDKSGIRFVAYNSCWMGQYPRGVSVDLPLRYFELDEAYLLRTLDFMWNYFSEHILQVEREREFAWPEEKTIPGPHRQIEGGLDE